MKLEAVLFDLDGVLINSFESWYRAFNAMLRRYGREEISKAEFEAKCWGPDLRHNLDAWGLNEEAGRYCINEQLRFVDHIELFPGVKEILARIRSRYRVGLVTNTPRKNVTRILNIFHIPHMFDVIITGDDVHEAKPSAEMVIEACNRLKVKPENTVLVGDTDSDFRAGKSAGCTVINIRTNGSAIVSNGDIRISNLYELLNILDL